MQALKRTGRQSHSGKSTGNQHSQPQGTGREHPFLRHPFGAQTGNTSVSTRGLAVSSGPCRQGHLLQQGECGEHGAWGERPGAGGRPVSSAGTARQAGPRGPRGARPPQVFSQVCSPLRRALCQADPHSPF